MLNTERRREGVNSSVPVNHKMSRVGVKLEKPKVPKMWLTHPSSFCEKCESPGLAVCAVKWRRFKNFHFISLSGVKRLSLDNAHTHTELALTFTAWILKSKNALSMDFRMLTTAW